MRRAVIALAVALAVTLAGVSATGNGSPARTDPGAAWSSAVGG